jgi:hypothetical protein
MAWTKADMMAAQMAKMKVVLMELSKVTTMVDKLERK